MQFNDSLISKLEGLSKLQFTKDERGKICQDLEKMVKMINKLESVDTDNVEPLVYLNEIRKGTRPDQVTNQISKSEALSNAPLHNDDFIIIPKVIDL